MVVQDKPEKDGGNPIGEFIPGDKQKPLKCLEENSGITHTNAEEKTEVVVNWQIPAEFIKEEVIVRATVVYQYDTADRLRKYFSFKK